jgi:hypothetical protein
MPSASNPSAQSNNANFVQQPRYSYRKTPVPPEFEKIKDYKTIEDYKPLVFKKINNARLNLLSDLNLNNLLAFFQLFFTNKLF